MTKILVAYDGSDCAHIALHDLRRGGLRDKAEAVVISAAEAWLPPTDPGYEIVDTIFADDPSRRGVLSTCK